MTVQFDLWQLVLLLLAFFGAVAGAVKFFFNQYDTRQSERFAGMDAKFARLEGLARDEAGQWQRVERELLNLKAELPLHYVRREDYVQAVATIMTKLDAMALRFENILLKGENRER